MKTNSFLCSKVAWKVGVFDDRKYDNSDEIVCDGNDYAKSNGMKDDIDDNNKINDADENSGITIEEMMLMAVNIKKWNGDIDGADNTIETEKREISTWLTMENIFSS